MVKSARVDFYAFVFSSDRARTTPWEHTPLGIEDSASNGPWKVIHYVHIYRKRDELIQVCFIERWKVMETERPFFSSLALLELYI